VTQGGLLLDTKKLRFENSPNKNEDYVVILTKLRFENSPNKKTLKQAWRFFLLYYLFVTQTYSSSDFLRGIRDMYSKKIFPEIKNYSWE
jgi:hypothetical protein